MKKVCFYFFCAILLVVSVSMGAIFAEAVSNQSVSGFRRTDFVRGVGYEGPMHLSTKGFSHFIYEDASISTFHEALYSDDVIFIHSHGAAGLFTLSSSTQVTGNMINSFSGTTDAKLVYISACNSGLSSPTHGNVGTALCNKGVDAVVAFEDTVAASTETNGIHRFNSITVYKLVNGYSISIALETAKKQIVSETGTYWGADSYVIYGNGSTTIN